MAYDVRNDLPSFIHDDDSGIIKTWGEYYISYQEVFDRLLERDGYSVVRFEPKRYIKFEGEEHRLDCRVVVEFEHKRYLGFPVGWEVIGWIHRDRIDKEVDRLDAMYRGYQEPAKAKRRKKAKG